MMQSEDSTAKKNGVLQSLLHFSASKFPIASSLYFLANKHRVKDPKHSGFASIMVILVELALTLYLVLGLGLMKLLQ